jgi:hypothetical protein
MTLLFALARLFLAALLGNVSLVAEKGLATRFGDPGDPLTGAHLYCTHQKLSPEQLACAHRTLPCGSVVLLHNPRTSKFAVCEVLDRGPFGAILPNGEWGLKIRPDEPGTWRGIIDLAPAVADALDFNGRERLQVVYQQPRRRRARPTEPAPLGAVLASRGSDETKVAADTEETDPVAESLAEPVAEHRPEHVAEHVVKPE